jgi:hypothetical protein
MDVKSVLNLFNNYKKHLDKDLLVPAHKAKELY